MRIIVTLLRKMFKEVIYQQKNELLGKLAEKYVSRNVLIPNMHNNIIKVITGPRRSGKSFFAMHTLRNQKNFGYANFDDEILIKIKNYNNIISAINSVYNYPDTLLFDEIQNLNNWELFVNRLQRTGYNLILTGSNSRLLSGELATHLTGRYSAIEMFPFSFSERLKFEGDNLPEFRIKELFSDYLIKGGYPELYSKNAEFRMYCSTLFENIIFKDIIGRYNIRNFTGINSIAKFIISNIANKYSYRNLCELSDVKSDKTVKKFVSYLEEAWIFKTISKYSFKTREIIKSPKKIYSIDNGFISANSMTVSPDFGKLLENYVADELIKISQKEKFDIYYWSNIQNFEVDFVLSRNKKVIALIQVCYNLSNPKTRMREYRSIINCSKELKCKNLYLITSGENKVEIVNISGVTREIKIIPSYKMSELLAL